MTVGYELDEVALIDVTIVNWQGNEISKQLTIGLEGKNEYTLDLIGLPEGGYAVIMDIEGRKRVSKRFIKMTPD